MGAEHSSVREVRPHAQVAPVQLRALERLDGGGGGLGVAVLDDGRARGPLGPAAREELDGRDLARRRAVVRQVIFGRVEVYDEKLLLLASGYKGTSMYVVAIYTYACLPYLSRA